MASQASKDIVLTGRWVSGWVGVHITTLAVGGTLNPKTNKAPQVIVNLIFQKHAYVIYRFFRVTKIDSWNFFFLIIFTRNIYCGHLRTSLPRRFQSIPTIHVLEKIRKILKLFN